MSFSAGAVGTKDTVGENLENSFQTNYSEVHPAVVDKFDAAKSAVEKFMNDTVDDGYFSVSVSGHAQEADPASTRDWLSISIQATLTPVVDEESVG